MATEGDQRRGRGHGKSAIAHALMMRSVPYFAAKMPFDQMAKLFKKSERTIERWSLHPDVRKALGDVEAHVIDETKATAAELVQVALATLRDIMKNAADEKARVTAASTTLDRFGYPATSRTEGTQDTRVLNATVHFDTPEAMRAAARGERKEG